MFKLLTPIPCVHLGVPQLRNRPLSLPTFFLAFPKVQMSFIDALSIMYLLVDPVLVDGPHGGHVRVEQLPQRHLVREREVTVT